MPEHNSSKKDKGKGKKIFLIVVIVILAIILISSLVLYVVGGSKVEDYTPEVGIEIIKVPFSGKGEETIPVQWRVHGAEQPLISGVYFGSSPSPVDFTKSPLPDQIGNKIFLPYTEVTLSNTKILQADVPNTYPVIYVVIYTKIKDQHYWSQEFMIKSG